MALYFVPGRGYISDQDEDIPFYGSLDLPDGSSLSWGDQGVRRLPEYTLSYQFPGQEGGGSSFQWEPGAPIPQMPYTPPGYLQQLLEWADQAESGQLKDYERQQYEEMKAQALAVPTRDLARLTSAAGGGSWGGVPEDADAAWWLTQSSPDLGAIMLGLRDKMRAGTATDAERTLFEDVRKADAYQHWVASVPQPSDAFNPLGNEFFTALGALGGAVGGAAAFGAFAPVAAGAAGAGAASAAASSILGIPTSTLATLGTIGSYGGTGAGLLGSLTGQPWLQKLGLGLGVAGGLAGGLAGLGNLASTGIRSVGDVARLAGSAGRITGALGRATGVQPLQQAARYMGLGSQLGGVSNLLSAAQGVQQGATQGLADAATRGEGDAATGGDMEWDYSWDYGGETPYDNWSWDAGATTPRGWETFMSWGDPYGPGSSGDPNFTGEGEGSGNWLGTVLGGLGGFLGKNASWLGPAVSGITSLGAGALGAGAASDAARLQAAALNRGIDLQTAQWLQSQANQTPWLEAGRAALPQLTSLAGQGQPTLGHLPPISGAGYALPGATPGWTPGTYGGYTPVDLPGAGAYHYWRGQPPAAAEYRYRPGAVPTLSGKELLANDPGVQFRLERARNALEGSAAARGSLLSGPTLQALQEQGQDLASQEYANAWQRASQQAQLREQWAQTASQLGYGQALSEAEARERYAQAASQINWGQAAQDAQMRLGQQQFGWQAGLQAQQLGWRERQAYDEALYSRLLGQNQLTYGRDWQQREAENQRLMDLYNAQRQGAGTQWNQLAGLAGLGQTAVAQLGQLGAGYGQQMANLSGQLGTAQGMGQLGPALSWQQGIAGLSRGFGNTLAGLNA